MPPVKAVNNDAQNGLEAAILADAFAPTGTNQYRFTDITLTAVAIPEPGTYASLAGLLGLAFVMVRRRQR